jgi:hypothetical protein
MSNEDQMAAIGRMVTERTEAKRQLILRLHELEKASQTFYALGLALRKPVEYSQALRIANDSNLDNVKAAIEDYQKLEAEVRDLTEKLKSAGVE